MKTVTEMLRLDGRVTLVTGGAGHIGRAALEAFAEQGAHVVAVDIDAAGAEKTAASLATAHGVRGLGIGSDVNGLEKARVLVDRVVSELGRLDVVVHCAGLTGQMNIPGYAVPFDEQSDVAWQAAFDVNLSPLFWLARTAKDVLAAHGNGALIGVSSIYGLVGPNMGLYDGTRMGNPAAYAATKGGMVQLVRYLSTVLAPRIRANTIAPGGIARGQDPAFVARYERLTPLARMGTEEDLKAAFAYLASDASAWVTGQCLAVDGGWTAW